MTAFAADPYGPRQLSPAPASHEAGAFFFPYPALRPQPPSPRLPCSGRSSSRQRSRTPGPITARRKTFGGPAHVPAVFRASPPRPCLGRLCFFPAGAFPHAALPPEKTRDTSSSPCMKRRLHGTDSDHKEIRAPARRSARPAAKPPLPPGTVRLCTQRTAFSALYTSARPRKHGLAQSRRPCRNLKKSYGPRGMGFLLLPAPLLRRKGSSSFPGNGIFLRRTEEKGGGFLPSPSYRPLQSSATFCSGIPSKASCRERT